MEYDDYERDDYTLCDDPGCSGCSRERARRAERDEERTARGAEAVASAASPVLREDGTLPVPDMIDADALLTALDGDGRVTLTREDARRVVVTLAMRRAPDDIATITNLRERLTESRDAHRRDIDTIGSALMEEAESRDWCEIYDEVVEQLNANLSVELPRRVHDVTIYLSDDDGRSHYYVTVRVSGGDDEADAARQILDAIRGSAAINDWGYA